MQTVRHVLSRDAAVHYTHRERRSPQRLLPQAGPPDAPAILLLHGFPTSSHMFRNLIPLLAEDHHLMYRPHRLRTLVPAGSR